MGQMTGNHTKMKVLYICLKYMQKSKNWKAVVIPWRLVPLNNWVFSLEALP